MKYNEALNIVTSAAMCARTNSSECDECPQAHSCVVKHYSTDDISHAIEVVMSPRSGSKQKIAEVSQVTDDDFEERAFYFNVTIADNAVDRDNQYFTEGALRKMGELLSGSYGITDNAGSKETMPQILYTWIEEGESLTNTGDRYVKLKARACIPWAERNEPLIKELEAGIHKEISVGANISEMKCSICKGDFDDCDHILGHEYDGQVCYGMIEEPSYIYNWAFVVTPTIVRPCRDKVHRCDRCNHSNRDALYCKLHNINTVPDNGCPKWVNRY